MKQLIDKLEQEYGDKGNKWVLSVIITDANVPAIKMQDTAVPSEDQYIFLESDDEINFLINALQKAKAAIPSIAIAIIAIMPIFSGCGFEGKYSGKKSQTMHCIDFRDGEQFTFNTDTIRDVVIGIGTQSHFALTDNKGNIRILSSELSASIKCTPIDQQETKK